MKLRNALIIIAGILILLNGLAYVSGNMNVPETNTVNKTAYIIGSNIFFLFGLILLVMAFFRHKQVNRKRRKKMVDSFLE